jgi:hypothetical protein
MPEYKIVTVDAGNVEEYGFFCVKNKKHRGYVAKLPWLMKRFEEGLRIKLLLTHQGRQAGFLEYIPGEYAWRAIHAPGYMVIHCIWVSSKKFPYKNMASDLLDECLSDAKTSGMKGAAVVTSDDAFMAGRGFFLKHGFEQVDEAPPSFQLLIKKLSKGQVPSFPDDWEERLKKYKGLQLIFANQCPYIGKAVEELPPVAKKHNIRLKLVELISAAEVREKAPSPYGVFNLIYDGRLLADHPISATRFRNILQKDLNLRAGK